MLTNDRNDMEDALASLFIAASTSILQRLRELDLPLTVPVVQTTIKRKKNNTNEISGSSYVSQKNILGNVPLHQLAPLLTPNIIDSISRCASGLVEFAESNLPFWSPFESHGWILTTSMAEVVLPPVDYKTDDVGWTTRHLLLPALYAHLLALPNMDSANLETARHFAKEVLEVAVASDLSYLVTVPLSGLKIHALYITPPTDSNATIRQLTEDEQGSLSDEWGITTSTGLGIHDIPLVELQLSVSAPRHAQYSDPDIRENLARWLCAFQLLGYQPSGHSAKLRANPRWVEPMTLGVPLTIPSRTRKWSTLSDTAFAKVQTIAEKLGQYHINKPDSVNDLALHRFCSGLARENPADSILDFVIALESLFLPYDKNTRNGDLGYRFRIHGAHYIAKTKSDRSTVVKELRDLYNIRSRLVHGEKYPTPSQIEDTRNIAQDFARRGLLRAVNEGFPDVDTFNKKLLGT
jgi:hypothetical protein